MEKTNCIQGKERKVLGSFNRCIYDRETGELTVTGWYLPRPDRVEIWTDECKIGEAELGKNRPDVTRNFPEYNDPDSGWECKIKRIAEKPLNVYSKAIYDGKCERRNQVQKIEWRTTGRISSCAYEFQLGRLGIVGWYSPRPERVEIFIDGNYVGDAEFNDTQRDWEYIAEGLEKKPETVTARMIYDGEVAREDRAGKIEMVIKGSINTACYDMQFKQLTLEGWFLPEPDGMEIQIGGQRFTDVERHIERLDVYNTFAQYNNRNSGWKFEGNFENEVNEVEIVLKYEGEEDQIRIQSVEKRVFTVRKAVNVCEYNGILQCALISGWCLPAPKQIEFWNDKEYLGNAQQGIAREDVYNNFPLYEDMNCGWELRKYCCDKPIKQVTVKFIWENGDSQQMNVDVVQKNYKVVSFDLFDTLVVRPVMQPTDILKIVGARVGNPEYFREMRIYAEKYARRYKSEEQDDIGLDEIYDRFQELYNITDSEKEFVKATEIQVETDYIRPRHAVKKIYERARKTGTKVIVVTDMYLPIDVIKKILLENGYEYDGLYVSSAENAAKGSGKLYEKLIRLFAEENISPSEILHIGDNLHADIAMARKAGWDAFYIPKTMTLFERNKKLYSYAQNTVPKLDNRFFVGFLANMLFDDPFGEYDENTYSNGEPQNIGLVFLSAFLLEFTLWLLKNLKENGYGTVYLVYRDGYLIEKIIKLLEPWLNHGVETVPVYLSRALRYNGYCREENGFLRAALDYKVSPKMKLDEFVTKRLLEEDAKEKENIIKIISNKCNIDREDVVEDLERLFPALQDISDVYNRNAQSNMDLIDRYCKAIFPKKGKVAVFDVGYRGKVVDFLRKQYGIDAQGYHLLSYSLLEKHNEGAQHTQSYIQYGVKTVNSIKILHNLLEDVISVEEGTANKIIEEGGELKVYKEEYHNESDILKSIQDRILEYICDFLKLFGKDILSLEFDRYAEFDFICEFLNHANKKDAEILRKMQFKDSNFLGDVSEGVYQMWYKEREEK